MKKPAKLKGGLEKGKATDYALEIDSPTAVRTLNDLLDRRCHRAAGARPRSRPQAGGRSRPEA